MDKSSASKERRTVFLGHTQGRSAKLTVLERGSSFLDANSSEDVQETVRSSLRSSEKDLLLLIDSHCHLHDREFFSEAEAEACLERAFRAGVKKVICIGTSHEDSLAAREFAREHENVFWTYGIHPENADINDETFMFRAGSRVLSFTDEVSISRAGHASEAPMFRSGSRPVSPSPRVTGATPRAAALRTPLRRNIDASPTGNSNASPIAIGEVGLDYHYEGYDREAQIQLFEEMLQLAADHDLPVSFHVREAFNDFFPVVANFPTVRGVMHSFTDSKKVLRRILTETDFYVGVNGLATYSTLPTPPLERILLETDAPFLAPVPHRGGMNEPAFVADVADWLAQKLEVSREEIERATTENAGKLFGQNLLI